MTTSAQSPSTNTAPMDLAYAKSLGMAAHQAGQPRVPYLPPEIASAVADLPVGGGAADIFRAFLAGWDESNLAPEYEGDGATAHVADYALEAANGRHIRMATKVTLSSGRIVKFTERMPKGLAIKLAEEFAARNPMPRVLRQNALAVASDNPEVVAEVDRRWVDDPALTVGERLRLMDDLCVAVLREYGYEVQGR